MQYTNPDLPEGINTTDEHPLQEFSILLGGAVLLVVIFVVAVSLSATYLARYIPFETELSIAGTYAEKMERYPEQEGYLQDLADRLSGVMDLPEGMEIFVHYEEADVVNAFATLGGHIVMYRGLLEKLPNENALAMVLAHEMAHIKHRDPIASLGRGVAVSIAFSALVGSADPGGILGSAGLYTVLKFNRDMESAADLEALQALYKLYGHVGGAEELFEIFIQESSKENINKPPQFFLTHPLEEKRIERINRFQSERPSKTLDLTSLPADFVKSIQAKSSGTEKQIQSSE